MKKKTLLPMLIAAACMLGCALCFTACNDDGSKDLLGVRMATAENPSEKIEYIGDMVYVYGDPEISDWHKGFIFFKQFGDMHYEEVAFAELNVEYKNGYQEEVTAASVVEPGDYYITCSIPGTTNTCTVSFRVEQAPGTGFTMQVAKASWGYSDPPTTVTVKNPAGAVMQPSQSYYETARFTDTDDSEYGDLQVYVMKKAYYDSHRNQAQDYRALITLNDNGVNAVFLDNIDHYYMEAVEILEPGKYVLIGVISCTVHYRDIVCPAVEIEVTAN